MVKALRVAGDELFDLLNEAGAWGSDEGVALPFGELRATCDDLGHLVGYLEGGAGEREACSLDRASAVLAEVAGGWAERLDRLVLEMRGCLEEADAAGEPPRFWSLPGGGSFAAAAGARPARRRHQRKLKYRHPEDPARTWVGRGDLPVWLRREIEAGASLADFLVDGACATAAARQARAVREACHGSTDENGGGKTAGISRHRGLVAPRSRSVRDSESAMVFAVIF